MKATSSNALFLASGALMLAAAMGVGRFAYTPLLPVMEHEAGLSVSMAGVLASANLLTVFFSIGQIIGPLVATQLDVRFNSSDPALLAAAGTAAVAAIVTVVAIRDPDTPQKPA